MSYMLDKKFNICFQHLIQLFNSVIGFCNWFLCSNFISREGYDAEEFKL